MDLIITIKFKMSSMLSNILYLQDEGVDDSKLNLAIPIVLYSDLIEDMKYLSKDKLEELLVTLESDDKIIKNKLGVM
ncbi:hypothetical protein [Terrisporobacter sp.]|uniref:hypothetical protein n=1 Tax=Terrisporobacter sp. TaxID=1965305 RepID=UPI002896A1F9|nr:hypothetical protein [Terrisporobacter sp.]